MKQIITLLAIITAATLYSCTTVKVTKVETGKEEGLRYSLGKPFIQVNPNPSGDGSYTAELVYLPDENQTYAVSSSVFLTKYSLEINVDESGILKKVDLSKGGDTHAADAIGAAAEIAKSQLEAKKTKADAADAENKAKVKAAKEELAAVQDAIALKEIELETAKVELQSLKDTYTGDQITAEIKEKIRAAEVLVKKLQAERDALQVKKDAKQTAANSLLAANEPTDVMAWGPVLFEIKDTYNRKDKSGSVSLVAVNGPGDKKQKQFETINAVEEVAPEPEAPAITTRGTSVGVFDRNTGIVTISLDFDNAVINMVDAKSSIKNAAGKIFVFSDKANMNLTGKKLNMVFDKKNLPAGKYELELSFVYKGAKGKNTNGLATINIELK